MVKQPSNKDAFEILRKGFKMAVTKKNPFASKEQKWKEYNDYINSLKQETFDNNIISIIQMIDYGGKSASNYKNSIEHRDAMIVRWPRLGIYPELLLDWIKQCRKENGFEA
jgi:hypothetical protein